MKHSTLLFTSLCLAATIALVGCGKESGEVDGTGGVDVTTPKTDENKVPVEEQMKKAPTLEELSKEAQKQEKKAGNLTPDGRKMTEEAKKVLSKMPEKIVGQKAPAFTLKSHDLKDVSLSDYKGKIVVIEWFNYECPFCRDHYTRTTTFHDLLKKYPEIVLLSVNSTSHQVNTKNEDWVRKTEMTWPILIDKDGKVGRAYGAKTTPHMFVIDKAGMIVYEGAIDNAPMGKVKGGGEIIHYVDNVLVELTAGKPITQDFVKPYGCSVKY